MHFDPIRNAYIDSDTGTVVLQETDPQLNLSTFQALSSTSSPSSASRLPYVASRGTIAAPAGGTSPGTSSGYSSVPVMPLAKDNILSLDQIYYSQGVDMELQHALQMSAAQTTQSSTGYHFFDDWTLARTLQSLEFEFTNEEIAAEAIEGDFNAKEYKASRSCRRQLVTFSFVICLMQVPHSANVQSLSYLLTECNHSNIDRCAGSHDSTSWLRQTEPCHWPSSVSTI